MNKALLHFFGVDSAAQIPRHRLEDAANGLITEIMLAKQAVWVLQKALFTVEPDHMLFDGLSAEDRACLVRETASVTEPNPDQGTLFPSSDTAAIPPSDTGSVEPEQER